MKKRIKSVIAGTAIAAVMATAAFGIAGEVGARPVTSNLGVANVGKSDDDRGERLASIASVLGMTGEELHTALHSGQSLAAIASSKGVSVQKVVDAVVAELKAHIAAEVASGELTQSEADTKLALVTAKATELVNSTRPEGGRARHDTEGGQRLEAIASVLGMTGEELHTALHSGQSLAAIASSKGVSVQKVVDAVVAELKAHIAAEVASGELTQSEADTKLALVTAKATELVNSTRPEGGRARHGKGGHGAGEIGGNILPSVVVTETNA